MLGQQEIENRFTYHPPKDDQETRYNRLRALFKQMAAHIDEMCPDSREKSLAFTKLEETGMWANASIARNE